MPENVEHSMQPSKYQQAILEWLKSGTGHGCCNAVAGAGKTTVLRMAAQELQRMGVRPSEIKIMVFGKANSEDLINRFGSRWKQSIGTLHSVGFGILQQEVGWFKDHERIRERKYQRIAQEFGYVPFKGAKGELIVDGAIDHPDDLYKLLKLVRVTLTEPTPDAIAKLTDHFSVEGINSPSDVAKAVQRILREGEEQALEHIIDFTDQIWLPVKWELGHKPWFKNFRWVMVDEAHDLNKAQLELAMMLVGKSGRLLAVGDPKQAVMGFSGADNRSYQNILERTKVIELPLSICYRCPRSHLELVRKLFPSIPIEPKEDAPDGTIAHLDEKELDQHLKVGDMVISRKTAPLVSLCIKLISKGIAATVKGRDIGETLKRDLDEIAKLPGFRYSQFNDAVAGYGEIKRQKYKGLDNEEELVENLNDKLAAIFAIYQGQPNAQNVEDLGKYIDSLFSDEHSPITLSTCHRAKGLEGECIVIIKPKDMPMVWRNQMAWQKEQENNLLYVALTRSKSELFVVGTPDWLNVEEEPKAISHGVTLGERGLFDLEDEEDELEAYAQAERASEEDLLPEQTEIFNNLQSSSPYAQLEQEIREYFKVGGLEEPKLTQAYEGVVKVASGTMGRNDIDERLEIFFSPTHRAAVKRFALRLCDLREAELQARSAEQQAIEAHLEAQREVLGMRAEGYEFEGEVQITPDQILVKGKYRNSKTYTYPRSTSIPDWASGLPVLYYPSCKPQPETVEQSTVNIFSEPAGTNEQLPLFPTKTSKSETAIASPEPAKTVNDLQSLAMETLETPQKPASAKKAITYPFKRWIEPWRICTDRGTQSREQIDQRTINNYAEQMRERLWDWEREPLPIIFDDGENWYPGDGHHRLIAAVAAEQPRIKIEVRQGSLRDAQFFSCGANRFHGLPRTNADKRNQVELLLRDEEWQILSDRAIAEHCGVSAPFVGKIRAELAESGTIKVNSERVDRKGRKINTANIGTKPKQSQAEQEEQQPLETEAAGAPVSISTWSEPITHLPPQAQAPTPEASDSANRSTLPKAEDVARNGSSPQKQTQAKLRIEGEQSEDIDKLVQRLRQVLDLIEESRDYPNRGDSGMRRYLTIRV